MSAELFVGISQLVQPREKAGTDKAPLEITADAALLVHEGVILAAGPRAFVLTHRGVKNATRIDLGGRAIVPGFVDSHTHVVFAGNRIDEMARRARGETYEEIAKAGGGIMRSATLLADTPMEQIVAESLARVRAMAARGTTTLEVKSGYGLLPDQEKKHLEAIAKVAAAAPASLIATVLAHVVPPSFRENRAAYVQAFCQEVLPAAHSAGVRFCDVFVDGTAFLPDEARQIAARAKELGLALKLHVDQLHDGEGAALAAELGALSADHLEFTNASGVERLARAGVVATVLPGCRLFLGKGPWPNARVLRDAGCDVAVATDCNPGSSMVLDLALCATLAVTHCGLSLEEALWAITRGGARALGLSDRGRLLAGERADFVVVEDADWRAILYRAGAAPIERVVSAGA